MHLVGNIILVDSALCVIISKDVLFEDGGDEKLNFSFQPLIRESKKCYFFFFLISNPTAEIKIWVF